MSILITPIPAAAASATTQDVLVEISERVCKTYCVNSSIQPTASVAFTQGSVKVVGGYAVVPVTATITIVTPGSCGCAHTQVYAEKFDLAFTATTANTITIEDSGVSLTEPINVTCCKAKGLKLTTTLTATIA